MSIKYSFIGTQQCPFVYVLSLAAFTLEWQSWVKVIENMAHQSLKPLPPGQKTLTYLTEEACQPCLTVASCPYSGCWLNSGSLGRQTLRWRLVNFLRSGLGNNVCDEVKEAEEISTEASVHLTGSPGARVTLQNGYKWKQEGQMYTPASTRSGV